MNRRFTIKNLNIDIDPITKDYRVIGLIPARLSGATAISVATADAIHDVLKAGVEQKNVKVMLQVSW